MYYTISVNRQFDYSFILGSDSMKIEKWMYNGEEVDFASDCTMAEIIYAYCDYMGMSRKEADKLKCTYEFDGGQFLFHKVINRETFEIHGEIDI